MKFENPILSKIVLFQFEDYFRTIFPFILSMKINKHSLIPKIECSMQDFTTISRYFLLFWNFSFIFRVHLCTCNSNKQHTKIDFSLPLKYLHFCIPKINKICLFLTPIFYPSKHLLHSFPQRMSDFPVMI